MLRHPCEDCKKDPEGEGAMCFGACDDLRAYTERMEGRPQAVAAIHALVEEFCGVGK